MQKDDINDNILAYPSFGSTVAGKNFQATPSNDIMHHINIFDLGLYRIKSHCHYDLNMAKTTDFSIFQVEIINEEVQRQHQGRFILEIWNKSGERIFQKILREEITQWKLQNNTFLFKGAGQSPVIYLIWLNERKMAAIKHPYDDNKEIDLIYHDNLLIVAQGFNFRFTQVDPKDITTTITQYQNSEENQQAILEKEFSGIIQNDKILKIINNPNKNEVIFICIGENCQLVYYRLVQNKTTEKRQVTLQIIEIDQNVLKKMKARLDKKQMKLIESPADVQQIQVIFKNNTIFLIVLRINQTFEVIENLQQTVYVEQRLNLTKMLPSFGEKVTFQFTDNSIQQSPSLDKLSEKLFLTEDEYYKQQINIPQSSPLYDIQKNIHFYQDTLIINEQMFLLRDNSIFVVDTITKEILHKFFQKNKVLSLHKLKSQSEDERGYKVTQFRVVSVHQNGTLQVFVPEDNNLATKWQRQEISQTNIVQQKETVVSAFQNQTSLSNLYIVSQTASEGLKVYQMQFNKQIIELNLKLKKGDHVFTVNSISRQRDMIGVVEQKYLQIYRNDKGNLIKLYQLNHTRFEFRDLICNHSIYYFQKEYILVITKKSVIKINVATSTIDISTLNNSVKFGGNCLIDASTFYFLTEGDEEGQSKLAVADTQMIEASFQDLSKDEKKSAIVDQDSQKKSNRLMYPSWNFSSPVRRLDYDEYNAVVNLQLTNYEIVQVPLFHRNTMHFIGMAERSFYLAFKKHHDKLYALDKNNFLNCWSMENGQHISKQYVTSGDYRQFETDKDLYDKDWFPFTLIFKQNQASPNSAEVDGAQEYRTYKVIDIDERGSVFEWLTFIHPVTKQMKNLLYFNTDMNLMIEVLIPKIGSAIYNIYQMENVMTQKWKFIKQLNLENKEIEWHHKSLFPYNVNQKNFEIINQESIKNYDTYKFLDKSRIKILNTQDGIEMVYNLENKQIDGYMALQYSFTNTKESFYDKKCGHFYIQEVTSRLQNFYEQLRRKIYLQSKTNMRLKSLDVSARDYKYKYVIEQSYTVLDYQFYQQYIQGKEKILLKTLKQLSTDHIQRLVHNIFPIGNNTMLHFIAESDIGFESIDHLAQLAKKEGFVIPFLLNSDLLTPLDITVTKKDFKQTNSLVKMLSKTPLDHHSRLLSHLVPKLIDMNLPALDKYFDRRKFQSGVCKSITLGRIKIDDDQDFRTIPTTLLNDNADAVNQALMNPKSKEQSINLEVLDVPLHQFKGNDWGKTQQTEAQVNDYEIRIVKSLANTYNQDLFSQKSVRSFIDYIWPHSRSLIIKNLFLPYLAFILYYMIYLVVLKKLSITQESDPTFFNFTAGMFTLYDIMFKIILFLGCFYFFYQDFLQIKNFTNNPVVLWSYANIFPLSLMIFIIVYDLFIESSNQQLEKTFYSASSFFIWIRVIHLLKCFDHTAFLLRMGAEILHKMRYLIAFIIISLLAFGFTFYFVSEFKVDQSAGLFIAETPYDGIGYMFQVLLGQYDTDNFNNVYLTILQVLVSFFNFFFIFTLIIALSASSFSTDSNINSNEAYQDKASLIALYSYLMGEVAIREPTKKYLLLATVTEGKKGKSGIFKSSGRGDGGDMRFVQAKMLKTMDRRLNNLTNKVEKTLKDISDRLDTVSQQQRND